MGSAVFFGIGDDYRSGPIPAEIPLIIIHSLKNLKLLVLCKLALFLDLKEESVASQCINQLFKSSKVGYVRAATPYFIVFPCFFFVFLPI